MNNFGQFIKQLRTDKGWTQTQLAAKLELDTGGLSKIENGKKKFKEKQLELFAPVFELNLDKVKEQYFSDEIASLVYKKNIPNSVLQVAENKVQYLKSKDAKQGSLKL
jgi:transcriptional regulator with XRE-family HTH domain